MELPRGTTAARRWLEAQQEFGVLFPQTEHHFLPQSMRFLFRDAPAEVSDAITELVRRPL